MIVAVVVVVVVFVLAGCGGGSNKKSNYDVASIGQKFDAAVAPADTDLSEVVAKALALASGSKASLQPLISPTQSQLGKAVRQLNAISAPETLQQDIGTVATDMTSVISDLTAVGAATGPAVQPATAKLVADAGRVSAAENVVQLALMQAENTAPTTVAPLLPAPTTTVPVTSTTRAPTSHSHRTTTTTSATTSTT
ncbi:MAG TPA: hypothetical protein VHT30_07400 [Acidimicrobiales bacterium]|nr:hypothetical protein [Acidimicrobiales bacterium]